MRDDRGKGNTGDINYYLDVSDIMMRNDGGDSDSHRGNGDDNGNADDTGDNFNNDDVDNDVDWRMRKGERVWPV